MHVTSQKIKADFTYIFISNNGFCTWKAATQQRGGQSSWLAARKKLNTIHDDWPCSRIAALPCSVCISPGLQ